MNVFLCCIQSPYQWDIPSYSFWRENFKPSLEALGCTVIEPVGLDLAEPLARAHDPAWRKHGRPRLGDELFALVRAAHKKRGVDLFFSYFFASQVHPDILVAIRDLGIPVVNFFCDNMREFESVRPLVGAVTLNWVPEVEALPIYQALKVPAIHLPMAVNPSFYGIPEGDELPQVSFIGSGDHLRMKLLAPVLGTSLPLSIYGRGWGQDVPKRIGDDAHQQNADGRRYPPSLTRWQRRRVSISQHFQGLINFGPMGEWRPFAARRLKARLAPKFSGIVSPPLPHGDFVRVLGRSAVTLGINCCPNPGYSFDKPLVVSKLRDLEAPLVGACYLTERCPDVDGLFEDGTEIFTYRNSSELVDKASMLLRDSSLRERLRQQGRKVVIGRHTWEHRFRILFRELGLR